MIIIRILSKYPGYAITPDGRIQGPGRHGRARWLKSIPMGKMGYHYVNLRDRDGKRSPVQVHKLVALAFLGDPAPGQEVRHLNGNCLDNRSENLTRGTRAENMEDARLHGSRERQRLSVAKLTQDQVSKIRAEYAEGGISQRALGAKYGVHQVTIGEVIRGVTWR